MSLSDFLFGKPHRVLQVKMTLVDEETGQIFAAKVARIHETDFEAGEMHLAMKSKEIMVDAAHVLKKEPI